MCPGYTRFYSFKGKIAAVCFLPEVTVLLLCIWRSFSGEFIFQKYAAAAGVFLQICVYFSFSHSSAFVVAGEGQTHRTVVANCNFLIPLIELVSNIYIFSLVTRSARRLSWIWIADGGNDIGFARLLLLCSSAQITEGHFMYRLSPRGPVLQHSLGSALPRCCCHGSQSSQVARVIFRCCLKASRGASQSTVSPSHQDSEMGSKPKLAQVKMYPTFVFFCSGAPSAL